MLHPKDTRMVLGVLRSNMHVAAICAAYSLNDACAILVFEVEVDTRCSPGSAACGCY